jgi:hypothetical protein
MLTMLQAFRIIHLSVQRNNMNYTRLLIKKSVIQVITEEASDVVRQHRVMAGLSAYQPEFSIVKNLEF